MNEISSEITADDRMCCWQLSARSSLVVSQDKSGYVTTGWEMLPFLPYKVREAPYEN